MDDEIKYEDAIKRLEDIVSKLENSTVSLDESIKLFDEGVKLSKICSDKLKSAEQKITLLTKENEGE